MGLKRYSEGGQEDRPNESRTSSQKSLLYVEDNDANWDITQYALRKQHHIVRAASAREAFKLLSEEKFDLILMDIELGSSRLDGIQITQILRGLFEGVPPAYSKNVTADGIPIVFVTAYAGRYDKATLIKAGGDDLVTKPVDTTRLSLCISRLIVQRTLQREQASHSPLPDSAPDERRSESRVAILPKTVTGILKTNQRTAVGMLTEISSTGARITFAQSADLAAFSPGTKCSLNFEEIWDGTTTPCEVVRVASEDPPSLGLSFTDMPSEARSAIRRWLWGDS